MRKRAGRRTEEDAAGAEEQGGVSCSVEWGDGITARASLLVTHEGEKVIGPRFVRLLREITAQGSVRGAARRLNVGHRHAIAWIRRAEAVLGRSLVQRHAGGVGGGGAALTPAGETLVLAYVAVQADIARRLAAARTEIFGAEHERTGE